MSIYETRRQLIGKGAKAVGLAALANLLEGDGAAAPMAGLPHHAPTAKRVIWLHQSGGPSQLDLFDYKPQLKKHHGTELPGSVRMGQRITGMTSGQASFPVATSIFKFEQAGKAGIWMSELIPHVKKIADEITVIKSVHTDAINDSRHVAGAGSAAARRRREHGLQQGERSRGIPWPVPRVGTPPPTTHLSPHAHQSPHEIVHAHPRARDGWQLLPGVTPTTDRGRPGPER